jgi:hypothetical protein
MAACYKFPIRRTAACAGMTHKTAGVTCKAAGKTTERCTVLIIVCGLQQLLFVTRQCLARAPVVGREAVPDSDQVVISN